MKVSPSAIKSVGLTTLYEPNDPSEAVADVVLVHGLGGHPVRSWKWIGRPDAPQTPKSAKSGTGSFKRLLRRDATLRRSNSEPLLVLGTKQDSSGRSRNVLRKNSLKSMSKLRLDTSVGDLLKSKDAEVYWPLDLLPRSCPNARISVWGYYTLVSDGHPLRLQNNVFAHARELLLDLVGARANTNTSSRPIIFVAHSTGGILVKEVLRLSEQVNDGPVKSVLLSTSAIIFLGCPHRSSEHARLGDAIRSMASMTLGVDSRDPALRDLSGSASLEMELGRQAFTRMWNNYNFSVKTYQESMVSGTKFLEIRAEAAVRRQASFFGNPRESAETIPANHLDMCQFSSAEDSGYRSLANTLARYIRVEANHRHNITPRELECLAALTRRKFPLHDAQSVTTYPGTHLWLYDMPEFKAWHHRTDRNKNKLLWIKGQSGSGKSVLLRSLRSRIKKEWAPAGGAIISAVAGGRDTNDIFFPGSCVQHVETDPSWVYRSLLAQLFLQDPHLRKALVAHYEKKRDATPHILDDASIVSFFVDDYIDSHIETPSRRTFIFIDVSDSVGPSYLRDLLSHLSTLAQNSDFSICLASGNPLDVSEPNAIDVLVQQRNQDDILRYANITLVAEWEERNRTVVRIGQKAAGVFLWAEIVVNILNAAIGEGASQDMIEYTLEEMPSDLHGLYEWMLNTLNDREKREALILFQWVILSAEPMRLNDLLVAVRLTKTFPHDGSFRHYMALDLDPPSSMRDIRKIRNSEVTTDNPVQFTRWIRARSIGLLELQPHHQQPPTSNNNKPANQSLGLQLVRPTHDSVRTFFLSGRGFACLSPSSSSARQPAFSTTDLIDRAHYAMLNACLTYLNMRDFEPLASSHPHSPPVVLSPLESPNWARNVCDQRELVTSSYPFLRYAVRNMLFHLLCPGYMRYFLPQQQLLRTMGRDRCRLWRRWTSLLGCADPEGVVAAHMQGPAGALLSPVFGARYRLERVFRKLGRMPAKDVAVGGGGGVLSPGVFPVPPGVVGEARPGVSEKIGRGGSGKIRSGGSMRSPRSVNGKHMEESEEVGVASPCFEEGKMSVTSDWNSNGTTDELRKETGVAPDWPLSPESGYTSHYSSPPMSGYSSHYSSQVMSGYSSGFSSKRSPLRVDTFQAIDAGLGMGASRVEVGFGGPGYV
ncbi:hypothetical protein GE09DRAFT_344644 [Coniochaeta sp. 2T2.1]|nr:hypothetical protein GE09DRAFT_344644 [Coniochaeta sp. 2T2.1]